LARMTSRCGDVYFRARASRMLRSWEVISTEYGLCRGIGGPSSGAHYAHVALYRNILYVIVFTSMTTKAPGGLRWFPHNTPPSRPLQCIDWAPHPRTTPVQNMCVDHGRLHIAMAEEFLKWSIATVLLFLYHQDHTDHVTCQLATVRGRESSTPTVSERHQ
jgi:hypothetical protein